MTAPLWAYGTWCAGGAVTINRKRRQLGGLWRTDKSSGFELLASLASRTSREKGMGWEKLWIISSGWQLNLHAMSCSVSKPLLKHGWKLLKTWHFLPNSPEEFIQPVICGHLLIMLTWKLIIYSIERLAWTVPTSQPGLLDLAHQALDRSCQKRGIHTKEAGFRQSLLHGN